MSARGRPRELPSQLPRLDQLIAVDPSLEDVAVQASSIPVARAQQEARFEKQAKRMSALAHQRAKRQIEQLSMVCSHSKLMAERQLKRIHERVAKENEQLQQLDQLRLAAEAGLGTAVPASLVRQMQKKADLGAKKPRLTKAEDKVIDVLRGTETQAEIASSVGVSQTTVTRHMRPRPHEKQKSGRKKRLTAAMRAATAWFLFLSNTSSWLHGAAFVKLTFGIQIHLQTLAADLKSECGFRLGDFRKFPRDRNSKRAITSRYKYATHMQSACGPNTLYNAIYFDETNLTRTTKRRAWSIFGWTPTVADEFGQDTAQHISLFYAASPLFGLLYYEILEGGVSGEAVLGFIKEMMAAYAKKNCHLAAPTRALIMDNAKTHHRDIVTPYLQGETVAHFVWLSFPPPPPQYSPFLNPVEEVFGLMKYRLWKRRTVDKNTDESKALLKKSLSEEVQAIEGESVRGFYFHIEHFLQYSRGKAPVFTQQLYENGHTSDETELCAILPREVELLLDSYLSHTYDEFTPEMNSTVERAFGVARLTMDDVNRFICSSREAL